MAKINKQAGNKLYREQGENTTFNLEYNLPRKITEDTNNFTNNVFKMFYLQRSIYNRKLLELNECSRLRQGSSTKAHWYCKRHMNNSLRNFIAQQAC